MAGRWGIGEWYGHDIEAMTPEERSAAARIALERPNGQDSAEHPTCPFLDSVRPGSPCNKAGGVCSIRLYEEGPVRLAPVQPATVCPSRFLEKGKDGSLFEQIASEVFGSGDDIWVIREIPFLQKVNQDGSKERSAKAGRIDWVITQGKPSLSGGSLIWAAVETQAVYFSGKKFEPDFESYLDAPPSLTFPKEQRRPDYRSSGAKRLAPQLDVKVPVMRRWGKKTVVIIDQGFADQLSPIDKIADDIENCEIVLAIVSFRSDMTLKLEKVVLTYLDSIVSALQATAPVGRAQFEVELKAALHDPRQAKVHRA